MTSPEKKQSFEEAFHELEVILERMNNPEVTLEESLALFEKADGLMALCQKRLQDAEKKVEILVKGRSSELKLDPDGRPEKIPFSPQKTT